MSETGGQRQMELDENKKNTQIEREKWTETARDRERERDIYI